MIDYGDFTDDEKREIKELLSSPYGAAREVIELRRDLRAERQRLADVEERLYEANNEVSMRYTQAEVDDMIAADRRYTDKIEAGAVVLREAIEYLFQPGPGVAVPEKYEPDYGEPSKITWNAKIDKLHAALTTDAGSALLDRLSHQAVALAAVQAALVDGGVPVPEDERQYGDAVCDLIMKMQQAPQLETQRAQGWREEAEDLRADRERQSAALANVSGALVDSGVIVPEDETRYGEAVRELNRERDRLAAEVDLLTTKIAALRSRADHVQSLQNQVKRERERVATLEAALESMRPHKPHEDLCAEDFDEGPCDCAFGDRNRRIDAALIPPPREQEE